MFHAVMVRHEVNASNLQILEKTNIPSEKKIPSTLRKILTLNFQKMLESSGAKKNRGV